MNVLGASWFHWAIGIAIGVPVGLILLTELHNSLARRNSHLARQVTLLRNFLLPLGALLLFLVKASQVPAGEGTVRILTTVFGFLVLVLLLSALNATVFASAPQDSWLKRLPTIFLDVARFALIGIGLAMILSYVWGVRVGGIFTALGVTSVVIGLMLQNSVGQIVSGLFMLFEQPFRIDDWLDTPTARGRVVEVNWRAVHIETGTGLRITPNSVLATTAFTNLSRPGGSHKCTASITRNAREASSVHHVKMPAKRSILSRHGKWAVDVVSGRDHREVRQGVCGGAEGGQGADSGSGGGGHRLVA
ncbi:hypothetical protein MSHO_31790 [Mycobacterium shottsii]|uniref:Mechanosensitive ion channel protein n=1 Tax=Mycobacterium shottsii TaxID=133549 RepID=A0A7I7LDP7_9MYCO|nr:hypothetical protein MSHO_31790 [Mycobacterium shottsii]